MGNLSETIQTVILTETGWYGSVDLWNDPPFAFRAGRKDEWIWLGNKKEEVAKKLDIPSMVLPEYDYEWVAIGEWE